MAIKLRSQNSQEYFVQYAGDYLLSNHGYLKRQTTDRKLSVIKRGENKYTRIKLRGKITHVNINKEVAYYFPAIKFG